MNVRQGLAQANVLAGIANGSRGFGGPYQASISLSNRCNLRCIHCYFYSPLLRLPNFFDVRQARGRHAAMPPRDVVNDRQHDDADPRHTSRIIRELVGMGTWRFHFSGSGEPLLHPQAVELMARVKAAGRECVVNTNGTTIDAAMADAFVEMGLDELRVTTMAGTAEVFERTHPGCPAGAFEALRGRLRALTERRAARGGRRPMVNLVTVVVRENAEDLADFARFAREVGADGVILQPMDDVGDPHLSQVVPTEQQAAAVLRGLPEVRRILEEGGLRHNLDRFLMVFNRRLDTRPLYRLIPCYMGWVSLRVQVGGDVYPCHRCYQPLGNAYETPVSKIWNSPAYRRFRREASFLNKSGRSLHGCSCHSCCHNTTNVRIFERLHPLSRRLRTLRQLCPAAALHDGGAG